MQLTRWQSSTLSVTGRSASTISGPIVMLGTNLDEAQAKRADE
jgi:hypothetical protein